MNKNQIAVNNKKNEVVDTFRYLDNIISYDSRSTLDIIARISIAMATFNSDKHLFKAKSLGKLHITWYMEHALYGSEAWPLTQIDGKTGGIRNVVLEANGEN